MISDIHEQNTQTIDKLEDSGRIDSSLSIVLTWTNNLEEIAREMRGYNPNTQSEELNGCFSVAKDYEGRMIRAYGQKYSREVGFALSRYNAIIRKARLDEKYQLGVES